MVKSNNKAKHEEDEKIPVRELCCEVIKQVYGGHLKFFEGSFCSYLNGYWPKLQMADVQKQVLNTYKTLPLPTVRQIVETLMVLCAVDAMEPPSGEMSRYLAFENGTLDLNTGTLIEHDSSLNLRTGFNFKWDEDASCDLWVNTLLDIFENDPDILQRIEFLQEYFGYCLTPDVSQQMFLWLVGKGSNGKSLILKILTALVGVKNVSNAKLERLGNSFVRAQLQGKLVNISSEMSANSTVSDGYLKEIVSGDRIEAEHKGLPSFSFTPFVKLVGATNILPRLLDTSDGFFRRAAILEMTRQFSVQERDIELEVKLCTEIQGIATWAVEGLIRMQKRGFFNLPASTKSAAAQYRKESDHVLSFTTDACKPSDRGVKPSILFDSYKRYARDYNFAMLNITTFGKRLAAAGIAKRRSDGSDYWLLEPIQSPKKSIPLEEFID